MFSSNNQIDSMQRCPMEFDSFNDVKSDLGTAAVIAIVNETDRIN